MRSRSNSTKKNRSKERLPNLKPIKVPQQEEPPEPPVTLDDQCSMVFDEVTYQIEAKSLVEHEELGRGTYGSVNRMSHLESGAEFAVKRVSMCSISPEEHKRLTNEITTSRESGRCPFMVKFLGAMYYEGDVWICMEQMDISFDKVRDICYAKELRIPEPILGKVAHSILEALQFMKEVIRMAHRDIKPSNMLVNRRGEIKLCDYGIAGNVIDSITRTVKTGSYLYMAPERIQSPGMDAANGELSNQNNGINKRPKIKGIDVRADVWSLGIAMIELATLVNPYKHLVAKSQFAISNAIIHNSAPTLPPKQFSADFEDFVNICLYKEFNNRPKFGQLLEHAFVERYKSCTDEDVGNFIDLVLQHRAAVLGN